MTSGFTSHLELPRAILAIRHGVPLVTRDRTFSRVPACASWLTEPDLDVAHGIMSRMTVTGNS
jgi:hypothetical protein